MKRIYIPEEAIKLYTDQQLTMEEIGKIYGVDRTTISNRLKKLGIAPIIGQRKNLEIKDTPLSQIQRDMIVGSVLGDASLVLYGRRKNAYFKVAHCEKQKEYLLWKRTILSSLVKKVTRHVDKRGNSTMYGFNTLSHSDMNDLRHIFYEHGKKIVREQLSVYMTPLGLATWFMDDGSRSGRGNNYRLSTDGFSHDDNVCLQKMLKDRFNLTVNVLSYKRRDKEYNYIVVDKKNSMMMTKIIEPYIVNCMKYKLMKEFTK